MPVAWVTSCSDVVRILLAEENSVNQVLAVRLLESGVISQWLLQMGRRRSKQSKNNMFIWC
jgi:hypothetical protein